MLTYNTTDKLKVTQMIGIGMTRWIDHVGNAIARRYAEQGIHRIKDFPRDYHIPLT